MSVDFKDVRSSFSLSAFFEHHMGASPKDVSGAVRYSICPSCGAGSGASVKVSVRNEKWHCFACEKKGDVIDAAAAFFEVDLNDAARQLAGDDLPRNLRVPPKKVTPDAPKKDQDAINEVIARLLAQQLYPDDASVAYLVSRGIPRNVVVAACMRKMLITLPGNPDDALRYLLDYVGQELLMKAGFWKEGKKCPGIIYRPLGFVSENRRAIEFRLIETEVDPSKAKTILYGDPSPCKWMGTGQAMIVEGGIDLLSAVTIGTDRTIYSVPGALNWEESDPWVVGLKGRNVLLALDDDASGDAGANKFRKVFDANGTRHIRHKLPQGCKDINDQLKKLGAKSKH
jgi:hypothetical protein